MSNLTIIILTQNAEGCIYDCLDSLSNQTFKKFNIIIVDNNSQDNTLDIIRDFDLNITLIKNNYIQQWSKAVNAAIKESESDIYVILDQSATVSSEFVKDCIESLKSFDIVCPKIKFFNTNRVFYAGGNKFATKRRFMKLPLLLLKTPKGFNKFDFGQFDTFEETFWGNKRALFVKKKVFDVVGFFDVSFSKFWETHDFCVRARQTGFKIGYIPKTTVFVKKVKCKKGIFKKQAIQHAPRVFFQDSLKFIRKHFGISFLLFWLFKLPIEVLSNVIYLIRR